MGKEQPLRVRLEEETERLVAADASRLRRSKSAIVEEFTNETARTRRFAGIEFRGEDAQRRPWVLGSGLDVWEIIHMLQDFDSAEALIEDTPLSPRDIRLAVAYRAAYPEEIERAIEENCRPLEDAPVLFSFIET